MTKKIIGISLDEYLAYVHAGMTAKEIELTLQLDEARALLAEAFAAMTPTAACQSVVYADIARYLDGTDDYEVIAE